MTWIQFPAYYKLHICSHHIFPVPLFILHMIQTIWHLFSHHLSALSIQNIIWRITDFFCFDDLQPLTQELSEKPYCSTATAFLL